MSREHEKKIEKYIELWSASSHLFPHFKDNSMNSLGLGPSSFVYHDVRWCPSVAAAIWTWSMHDHIISHCTWDDIRPFGDVSVGIHSPPEFLLHGDVFPWLVQWPTVASCGLYLPRPDSAPGISVHGAGLEVANGIYVRTGFKVGRIWKNCGALKLFVHLCAELPHKQGWPAINDYILEFYRIWTHIKTLYIRMCIIIMYIYIYSIMILYNYIHIIPNTSKYSSHRPMKFWRPGWQFWRLPKAWD